MSQMISACFDELLKIAEHKHASEGVTRLGAAGELAGLGILAAPQVDKLWAKHRARKAGALDAHGEISEKNLEKFRHISPKHDTAMDVAGLGILAAPYVKPLFKGAESGYEIMLQGAARKHIALRAAGGAIGGAAVGAVADKENRGRGAAKGALVGGTLAGAASVARKLNTAHNIETLAKKVIDESDPKYERVMRHAEELSRQRPPVIMAGGAAVGAAGSGAMAAHDQHKRKQKIASAAAADTEVAAATKLLKRQMALRVGGGAIGGAAVGAKYDRESRGRGAAKGAVVGGTLAGAATVGRKLLTAINATRLDKIHGNPNASVKDKEKAQRLHDSVYGHVIQLAKQKPLSTLAGGAAVGAAGSGAMSAIENHEQKIAAGSVVGGVAGVADVDRRLHAKSGK